MSTDVEAEVRKLVADIKPYDDLEKNHIEDTLAWIDSSAPLFRITKPDNPPKHLVCYSVLYDETMNRLMLVDHIKASSWLPAGGHVDPGENPRDTVIREASEELNIDASFTQRFGPDPYFVTVTTTKGKVSHTDVSLWFIVKGDSSLKYTYDPSEMNSYQWLSPKEILAMNISELDPHMHRFVRKLLALK
jgi:8-oxo-dGTP pyrophosphatase MutT (NUDIX family)